jgi:hypothetical protein
VLGAMILVLLATLSFTGLARADGADRSKVLTVDSPNVSCASPVPGPKVEGELGGTISVSTQDPIDFVTVKSGVGAVVVSAQFDTHHGQITLSKDISGYVVWTCPPTTTTPPPTVTTPADHHPADQHHRGVHVHDRGADQHAWLTTWRLAGRRPGEHGTAAASGRRPASKRSTREPVGVRERNGRSMDAGTGKALPGPRIRNRAAGPAHNR